MLTMRPLPARSGARNACVTLKTPVRLIAMMSSQSLITASLAPSMPLRRAMPALLTRIETSPTLSATCFAIAMQSSRLVTSSEKLSALPPASRISFAVSRRSLAVDIEHHQPCALAGIAGGDRTADAGASAGDGGDVVGEQGHGDFLLFDLNRWHQANSKFGDLEFQCCSMIRKSTP